MGEGPADRSGPGVTAPRPGERVAYLPPRAARARKLILRSQLGLPWIVGALVFAALILVAGGLLLAQGGRPGAPWVRLGDAAAFPPGEVTQAPGRLGGDTVVVDHRGEPARAFLVAPATCPVRAADDGFARPCTGEAWSADGAPTGGTGTPLERIPTQLARDELYVDPSRR